MAKASSFEEDSDTLGHLPVSAPLEDRPLRNEVDVLKGTRVKTESQQRPCAVPVQIGPLTTLGVLTTENGFSNKGPPVYTRG